MTIADAVSNCVCERQAAWIFGLGDGTLIESFRSKTLRQFWEDGNRRGLRPDLVDRVKALLFALHAARKPEDLVGVARFHPLVGKPQRYALSVNRNWRITFAWIDQFAKDVDLEDYH